MRSFKSVVVFPPTPGGKLDMRRAVLVASIAPGVASGVGRSRSRTLLVMSSSLATVCRRITSIPGGATRRNAASLLGTIVEDTEEIAIGVCPLILIFIVGSINSEVGTTSPGASSSTGSRLVICQGGRVGHGRSLIGEMTGLVIGG